MLTFLADIAVKAGHACISRSNFHTAKRDLWMDRAEYCSDVGKWLRSRCIKSLAEIRAERKGAKS